MILVCEDNKYERWDYSFVEYPDDIGADPYFLNKYRFDLYNEFIPGKIITIINHKSIDLSKITFWKLAESPAVYELVYNYTAYKLNNNLELLRMLSIIPKNFTKWFIQECITVSSDSLNTLSKKRQEDKRIFINKLLIELPALNENLDKIYNEITIKDIIE